MNYLVLGISCAFCTSSLMFVAGPSTPFSLDQVVEGACRSLDLKQEVRIVRLNFSSDESLISQEVIFDYTYNEGLSHLLSEELSGTALVLDMWRGNILASSRVKEYSRSFAEFLTALNFSEVALVTDTQMHNRKAGESAETPVYRENYVLPYETDMTKTLEFVRLVLKPSGSSFISIFTDPVSSSNLLTALSLNNMNKKENAFILSQEASWFQSLNISLGDLFPSGLFYIAPKELAFATSRLEVEVCILRKKLLSLINQDLISVLEPATNYVLMHINGSIPVLAASNPSFVPSLPDYMFPNRFPESKAQAVIQTSVNYDYIEPNLDVMPGSRVIMRGVEVAFQEINNRSDVLPNFYMKDYSVAFSGLIFDYEFTKQRISQETPNLGVIHFGPALGYNIAETFTIFSDLGIVKPIFQSSILSRLASPKEYPLYLRPRVGSAYIAHVIVQYFLFFEWTKTAILYENEDQEQTDLYYLFMNESSKANITVTNSESLRGLPRNLTGTVADAAITDIMISTVRIIVILHYKSPDLLVRMYDLGIRSEYLLFFWTSLSYTVFSGNNDSARKRRIVGKGALEVFIRPFVGDVGTYVLKELIEQDGQSYYPNSCVYYDATMLYMYATDYMIARGLDYEDPFEIVNAARGTYFQGCSGMVTIGANSNERSASTFSLVNLKYFSENDTVLIEDVGYYDPFSTILFQFVKSIQWPDDSMTFKDVLVSNYSCPFLEKDVRRFSPGVAVGFSVLFFVSALVFISGFWIWKRWWRVKQDVLIEKCRVSMEDAMQIVTLPLMFFQYISFGPNSAGLSDSIHSFSGVVSLHMFPAFENEPGLYFSVLDTVLVFVFLYVVICIIKLTHCEVKLLNLPLCSLLMDCTDILLPTWANLLFLPVMSILLEVFLCNYAIGDSFSESFLDSDCHQFCWEGSHLVYVMFSAVALLLYIPLAHFTKPLWQEMLPNLHLKGNSLALIVKSIVDVSLVVLADTLQQCSFIAHSVFFFAIITCYLVFMLRYRQFNYDLLNLWQVIIMMAVWMYEAVAVISVLLPSYSFPLLITFCGECILLLIVGVGLQWKVKRFENKLKVGDRTGERGTGPISVSNKYVDSGNLELQIEHLQCEANLDFQ